MRLFVLALALLCLYGCAGPAPQHLPLPTATPVEIAASALPIEPQTLEVLPTASIEPYGFTPAQRFYLTEDMDPYYLANTDFCPSNELDGAATLSGSAHTKEQLDALGESLVRGAIILQQLPFALGAQGLNTDETFEEKSQAFIVEANCNEIFHDEYLQLYLGVSPGIGGISLFFRQAGQEYVPVGLLDHTDTRIDGHAFFTFAGQPWMVYRMGGWGTGYRNDRAYWYNLATNQVELCYMYKYYNEGNVAEDVFQKETRSVLQAHVVENELENYVELTVYLRLEAQYWDKTEGGDVLVYAPDPDCFAAEALLRIYYNQERHAFYIRTSSAAYPLWEGNTSPELWRFYFGPQLQDFFEHGNIYQKRWASIFYD